MGGGHPLQNPPWFTTPGASCWFSHSETHFSEHTQTHYVLTWNCKHQQRLSYQQMEWKLLHVRILSHTKWHEKFINGITSRCLHTVETVLDWEWSAGGGGFLENKTFAATARQLTDFWARMFQQMCTNCRSFPRLQTRETVRLREAQNKLWVCAPY